MTNNFQGFFWWKLKIFAPYELEESLTWHCQKVGIRTFAIELKEGMNDQIIFWVWLPSFEWSKKEIETFVKSLKPIAETFQIKLKTPLLKKIHDEDWNSTWKKLWQPDPVGENLLILPSWLELPKVFSKKVVLKLNPGSAFGTGSHPTTRLCLKAIEQTNLHNCVGADIGCGSGILSLAALKFGAKEVIAVDIDSLAIKSTLENSALNNFSSPRLKTSLGSVEEVKKLLKDQKLDFLFCNTLAPIIENLVPQLNDIVSSQTHGFFSGLLADQIQDIKQVLEEYDWRFIASQKDQKWALIHCCRDSAAPLNHKQYLSIKAF